MKKKIRKLREAIIAGKVDFECFSCGYNLRGLAGESKTCPECGEVFTIDELPLDSKEVLNELQQINPVIIIIQAILGFGILALFVYFLCTDSHLLSSSSWSLGLLIMYSIAGVFSVVNIGFYFSRCSQAGMTRSAAWGYLITGFLIGLLFLCGFPIGYYFADLYFGEDRWMIDAAEYKFQGTFWSIAGACVLSAYLCYRAYRSKLAGFLGKEIMKKAFQKYLESRAN